jgi:hypothetical protein
VQPLIHLKEMQVVTTSEIVDGRTDIQPVAAAVLVVRVKMERVLLIRQVNQAMAVLENSLTSLAHQRITQVVVQVLVTTMEATQSSKELAD